MSKPITVELDMKRLQSLAGVTDAEIDKRIGEIAFAVEGQAKQAMQGTRSGKIYPIPGTRRTYRASAPGEPPAVLTGNLKNSIYTMREGKHRWVVGVGTAYAARLEFGGTDKNGVYIAPRPYLRPAVFSIVNRFPQYFKGMI